MSGVAGFVLAGGSSSRMGRDKALLNWEGRTLLEHVAGQVAAAAGSVTVIGAPERYMHLSLPCVADLHPGCGPLGGLHTALSVTNADWNLLVACDMPLVTPDFLARMIGEARQCGRDALVPHVAGGVGPEPLCAVYHRRLLSAAEAAIQRNSLKMQDFISRIDASLWPVAAAALFANLNTPEQLAR